MTALSGNAVAGIVQRRAEVAGLDGAAYARHSLRAGFAMRRLVRRGVPIRTPTYLVDEHLIWGATARILGDLLERLPS